jgi:hypothetical protein
MPSFYKIVSGKDGGTGSFLCPPGHPAHQYSLYGWNSKSVATRKPEDPSSIGSVEGALEDPYGDIQPEVKAQARRIFADAELVCSEAWLRNVYGYFRYSYSPDGAERNVSKPVSWKPFPCSCGYSASRTRADLQSHMDSKGITHQPAITPQPPAEHHLGYLCVREYFPDHRPRVDLIDNPGRGYGQYPCDKCGQPVQYEARKDAWCVVTISPWRYNESCPSGGKHEVQP